MKVLMVTGRLPNTNNPGSQSFITRQIDSLRSYCSKIDVYEVVGNRIFKHLKSARYISNISANYDIIHVHYGLYALSTLIARGNTPVVLSLMGSDLFGTTDRNGRVTAITVLEAYLSKYLANKCDRVIVKTPEMSKTIPNIKTHIIPNGVDLHLFNQMDMHKCRKHLELDIDKYYILFPGNPKRPEKNWNLAALSVAVAQQCISKKIVLLPLNEIIPYEVPVYINAVDLVLLTSFSEGSPNVVKEALACNKCVISVNVGDVALTIDNLEGCSLVEYDAELIGKEIACKLNYIHPVPGRARLRDLSLSLDSVAKRIMRIYEDLQGGPN